MRANYQLCLVTIATLLTSMVIATSRGGDRSSHRIDPQKRMMEKLFHATGVDSNISVDDLEAQVEPQLYLAGIAKDDVANAAIAEVLEWFDVEPQTIQAYINRREGKSDATKEQSMASIYEKTEAQPESQRIRKASKRSQRQEEVYLLLKRIHGFEMAFNWHPIDFVLRSDYLKGGWSSEQFGSIFKSLMKFYQIKPGWYAEFKRLMKKRRKYRMKGIDLRHLYQDNSDGAVDGPVAHIYGEPCKGLRDVSIDDPYTYERFLAFEQEHKHRRSRKGQREQKGTRSQQEHGSIQFGESSSFRPSSLSQTFHNFPLPISWRPMDPIDVPMYGLNIHLDSDHEDIPKIYDILEPFYVVFASCIHVQYPCQYQRMIQGHLQSLYHTWGYLRIDPGWDPIWLPLHRGCLQDRCRMERWPLLEYHTMQDIFDHQSRAQEG